MVGGGAYVVGGVHGGGHTWQGACMADTKRYGQ